MTTSPSFAALRSSWDALVVRDLGLADGGLFDEVVVEWSEDHRRYHTVEHLAAVVDRVAALARAEGLADPSAALLAAWFHDAIYDPRRSDNEARSADWARTALTERGAPAGLVDRVVALVLATADHAGATTSVGDVGELELAVLLDADLAVLASPPEEYLRYATAVREEYGFVGEEAYRAGRTRVLESLLSAPLFRTATMARLEAVARGNLARERARLASWEPALPAALPSVASALSSVEVDEGDAARGLWRACAGADPAVLPGELVVWAWVFDPPLTSVVLVDHPKHDRLLPPGGRAALGEDPAVAVRRELQEETGLVDVAPLFSGACLVDRVATASFETYGLAYAFVADPSAALAGEAGQPAAWYPLGARPARAAKRHWARVTAQAERLRAGRPVG